MKLVLSLKGRPKWLHSFIEFSINLRNRAFFLNLAYLFLLCHLLSSLLFANPYCIQYMVLKMVYIWILIFYKFFWIAALHLDKVLHFNSGVFIFLLLSLEISFVFLPSEELLSSMICNWKLDQISSFTSIVSPAKG